jgi:hypothetical protein
LIKNLQDLGTKGCSNHNSHEKNLAGMNCLKDSGPVSCKSRLYGLIGLDDSSRSKYSNDPNKNVNDYNSKSNNGTKPEIMTSDTLEAYGQDGVSNFTKKINRQAFIYDSTSNHPRSVKQTKDSNIIKKTSKERTNNYSSKGIQSK